MSTTAQGTTSNAAIYAAVTALQAQSVEMRQDVRDIKDALKTYVPQQVHDLTTRDLTGRMAALEARVEARDKTFVLLDTYEQRMRGVDGLIGELREALKRIPDTRRQQIALWLSAAAILVAGSCGGLSLLVTILFQVVNHH